MPKGKVLIIDDEADIRELLEISLGRINIPTVSCETVGEAKQVLGAQSDQISLCLTDMRLPDGSGMDVIRFLGDAHPHIPVAVITAFGNTDLAVESLKAGAFDFVSKPLDLKRLRELVNTALKLPSYGTSPEAAANEPQLLGSSPAMQELRNKISRVARSQAPVFISGESGSGKELVARLIHHRGARADGPFVAVNCGAIPGELMESEFFGHRKGSFTGAIEDKKGLFQAANGGTLFLDEVADLPLAMQVKLLRSIQEKKVRPVGQEQEVGIDVRILSATHKNLIEAVRDENFRQDLYYRIHVIELQVPPLRDRGEDIFDLAGAILARLSSEWQIPVPQLDDSARSALGSYHFPGNVRELENILERAIAMCDDDTITQQHLQLPVHSDAQPHQPAKQDGPTDLGGSSMEEYLTGVEKHLILQALEETGWNRTSAAKKLGLNHRSLRYRLKKLGLEDDSEQDQGSDQS